MLLYLKYDVQCYFPQLTVINEGVVKVVYHTISHAIIISIMHSKATYYSSLYSNLRIKNIGVCNY